LLPRQQRLKPATGAAWAQIRSTEFLNQLLVAVHDAQAALDAGFGVKNPSGACSAGQKQNRDSRFFCMEASFGNAPPGELPADDSFLPPVNHLCE
jgi:hypothetical protein